MASSFSRKWIYFVRSSSQYVDCGNVLDFERTTPFSISCWCARPSSAWGTRMSFVCKMDASSRGYDFSNSRGAGSPGSLSFRLVNTLSTNLIQRSTYSNDQFDDTGLHHYVVTYDGSSSSAGVVFYVDGYLRGSSSEYNTLTATTLNTGSLTFGRAGSTATDYLNGRMEDIAFYNKALSSAEVLALFTNGPNDLTIYGPTGNLIAWWKMGDGDTYPTLLDSGGSGYSGTMTNMSAFNLQNMYLPAGAVGAGLFYTEARYQARSSMGSVGEIHRVNKNFRGRPVMVCELGATGSDERRYYKMRAQDSGVTAPGYVTWVVPDEPDFVGAGYSGGVPTPIGPPVSGSIIVANDWWEAL